MQGKLVIRSVSILSAYCLYVAFGLGGLPTPSHARHTKSPCVGVLSEGADEVPMSYSSIEHSNWDKIQFFDKYNNQIMVLNATGPITEVVINDVGRDGEDGVMQQRVYKDQNERRWIYRDYDAHPNFSLYSSQKIGISCYPS